MKSLGIGGFTLFRVFWRRWASERGLFEVGFGFFCPYLMGFSCCEWVLCLLCVLPRGDSYRLLKLLRTSQPGPELF